MEARPVPLEWSFQHAPGWVVLGCSNPIFDGAFFIEATKVDEFCRLMREQAAAALAPQLTSVQVPLLGPDGNPVPPSPEVWEHMEKHEQDERWEGE